MNVAFAGGTTGGHIAPGIGLAERIVRDVPGSNVVFASIANEVEERMIDGAGFRLAKVARRKTGRAAKLIALPAAWLRARRLFASFKPDVVVGLGGGESAPGALAAITMRKPLVLLEQNVIPGRTNRRLAWWAAGVCCQWDGAARALGHRARFTGSPVRSEITRARELNKAKARAFFGLAPDRPTLLVMGGSQGAHAINLAVMQAAGRLAGAGIQVIHTAGRDDSPAARRAYKAAGLTAHVSSFLDAMDLAYAAANVALSRAGATSIAELAAAGLPAILVPYPYATDDHQQANAREAAKQGWARTVDQAELDADRAAALVEAMLADGAELDTMKHKAMASAREDAASVIIGTLCALASNGKESVAAGTNVTECAE